MSSTDGGKGSRVGERELTFLEIVLLRNLKNVRDEKELSKITNVHRKVVTKTLDELFDANYIGKDSMVTENPG